jgi:hypothetical protein
MPRVMLKRGAASRQFSGFGFLQVWAWRGFGRFMRAATNRAIIGAASVVMALTRILTIGTQLALGINLFLQRS